MLNVLYTIIIYPLYQIVEFAYSVFFYIFTNCGISIIGVSITITLLCLPLYSVAEKWQQMERNTHLLLKPGIERIKKTFKGDEQYMMMSTFYKQNHYHPIMALRSSFGLLIQIPFFIAAYVFLSSNSSLGGMPFLFIKDLGRQDALFHIGSFIVNILPIMMTAINIIAGAIYTKGFPAREKIQIYGMALIFLVILYTSPSGLVLYWTMNNVFSLVKNIFYKIKKPLKVFYTVICACMLCADIYMSLKHFKQIKALYILSVLVFCIPLFVKLASKSIDTVFTGLKENQVRRFVLFILAAISICFLTGILIPSLLITSSPAEYCYIDNYTTPLFFIYNSFLQTFGLFVFWPVCMYFLFDRRIQTGFTVVFLVCIVFALLDTFCFPGNYGTILPEVEFSEHPVFQPSLRLFLENITALAVAAAVILFLFYRKMYTPLNSLYSLILITVAGYSCINIVQIQHFFKTQASEQKQNTSFEKILTFSKTGKNVLMLMLDKAPGFFVTQIFAENPELYDRYSGFTFFPNTLSFATRTITGAPGLFGGYEYTPWEMNKRSNETMREKHNEAISLEAKIFSAHGYKCSVTDPPYPNYDIPPVFLAFQNDPNISTFTAKGKYNKLWYQKNNFPDLPVKSRMIKRNFLWFALFRIAPPVLRAPIHYKHWWVIEDKTQNLSDFINNYAVLDFLPEMTAITDSGNCYNFLDNETTHEPQFLQYPDYKPAVRVTDRGSGPYANFIEFHASAAAFRLVGNLIEYMKKYNVYDNTRIVIAADHGSSDRIKLFKDMGNPLVNYENFNPLLMFKDFNADGKMKTDNSFMTQADVPAIILNGLIPHPINPYTGESLRSLTTKEKNRRAIVSAGEARAVRNTRNNGFIIADTDWYTVHDNIFDPANWKREKPAE
jgi:YidC/Oxa1 family membrane protein insertase